MNRTLLTVAQLIERCVPPSTEFLGLWRRRLRDLTNIGAVPAAARQHEGTGKHRLYRSNVVPLAAVLLRLGDRGVQIGDNSHVARMILHPRKPDREVKQIWSAAWARDLHGREEAWLAIAPIPIYGGIRFSAGFGPVRLPDSPGEPDTWIITYLSRIFRQIRGAQAPENGK
jgi:DNA-binding transcriptional MerR regulator